MAEKGEKRDPSSHRTPGQIKRMDRGYNHQPEQRANRVENGKARKLLGLQVGDSRDAHHKKPLRSGGKTTRANVAPVSKSKNRGWRDGV
jgi:hypothetical protein